MTSAGARAHRVVVLVALALALTSLAGCRPVVAWFGRDPERITLVEVLELRGRQRVVVDHVEGPWYDAIGVASLVFTADGHVAYPARRDGRWHVVHDGRLGLGHDGVGELVMSPDGEHVIYAASEGEAWTVVVDGDAQGGWSALASGSLRLVPAASGGGLRWSFIGFRGEEAFVALDGSVSGPFDTASPALLDGRRSAFATVRYERARVFVDGSPGVPFAHVRDLQLVGGRVGYLGHSSTGSVVVLDGVMSAEHPTLRHLRLHPSGRWFAIRGESLTPEAPEAVVVGAWPEPATSAPPAEQRFASVVAVQQSAFLTDARVVWIGVTGDGAQVHVEAQAQRLYSAVTELVTHGAHYAYVGEREGLHHVVSDGVLVAREPAPVDSLVTGSTGEVAYHTLRGTAGSPEDVVCALGHEWPAPGFVEGSLVCLDDAPHCAHLAVRDEQLVITIDGAHHVPFDLEEAIATAARTASRATVGDDAWLRAWLLGELRWFVGTRGR